MIFNNHSNLEGQHAFLGASKYHWINYSEDKVAEAYSKFLATQKGTVLHEFACQCIRLGQKLPKSQKTLNMYVNDAIGFKMIPEQMLLTLCVIILVPGAMKMSVRTYTELISLLTFEERFRYLKLDGKIGEATFGFQRWVNQEFYHSSEWLSFRDDVIIRDNGCDLGIAGHEIFGPVLIHHINPITYEDIINRNPCVFDLENVICTQLKTHNAIHYGDESILILKPVQRSRNDTCPWRKN